MPWRQFPLPICKSPKSAWKWGRAWIIYLKAVSIFSHLVPLSGMEWLKMEMTGLWRTLGAPRTWERKDNFRRVSWWRHILPRKYRHARTNFRLNNPRCTPFANNFNVVWIGVSDYRGVWIIAMWLWINEAAFDLLDSSYVQMYLVNLTL